MEPEERIAVPTIDGYYDEVAKALTCDISERHVCVHHKFINASLHWRLGVKGGLSLYAEKKPNFHRAWGNGYGGIRYCERCKHIDCIHDYEDTLYEVIIDEFLSDHFTVGHCQICERRVLRSSSSSFHPLKEALDLIVIVAKEMNVPFTGDPLTSPFGSGYFCEFPHRVSHLLRADPEGAKTFIRATFRAGKLDEATMKGSRHRTYVTRKGGD